MHIEISECTAEALCDVAALASLLWPGSALHERIDEFAARLSDENALVVLAKVEGATVGFAQCQLRLDYVEGTDTCPVGYLEGIYVRDSCRKSGVATALLRHVEQWARTKGCVEFASDCELTNAESLAFHLRVGFEETNRVICFVKKLATEDTGIPEGANDDLPQDDPV